MLLPEPATVPGGDLPVRHVLPELREALDGNGRAVLVAPPGSGKTTLVPLALADHLDGRVIVAEPRRVAVRAAARRMAALSGTRLGEEIGYTVRGDRKTSARTRVEVVTTGVLVQRLHRDPELPGVAAIVVDECHERHLDTDLALGFAVDVRANLRDDLRLLATSATARAEKLASFMGTATPIVTATASPHPITTVWAPPARPVSPPHGLWVDPKLLDHVAATVHKALAEREGDVLVFLPGAGEIDKVAARLSTVPDVDVLTLHGRQDSRQQDAALQPGARRRVVLASAVAESSLTVPGVRVVVDAGLSREPRVDHARGLPSLVTVRVSRDSATQRAGRAAREAPGTVYRCWPEFEHDRLPAYPRPEIATADLTAFILHLARWGGEVPLLDRPADSATETAMSTLRTLGAVDGTGTITQRGEALAAIGTHPRLARALLDGADSIGARQSCEVVALLSADTSPSTDDLAAELRALRQRRDRAWQTETRRLESSLPKRLADATRPAAPRSADQAAALIVGLAFPERLARRTTPDGRVYLMTGGTQAELAPGSRVSGVEWLAIASADRQPGRAAARVRLAAPCDPETALAAAAPLLTETRDIAWRDGDVRAHRRESLGAITLVERPLTPKPDEASAALRDGLRAEGLNLLRPSREAETLRSRLAFCRHVFGDPWPDVDDAALLLRLDDWLGPELAKARRRADLERADVASALRRLLPWEQAAALDRVAPSRVTVPSGSKLAVDYTDPTAPKLAGKLQEFFGWTTTPTIADGRAKLVVHLLSPAGRPAAVTGDLESFWRTGYPQVRAELRGRYPKHPWPEDPTTAEATSRVKRR
nr:ATP-dependent helicase HrpB [Stackebrandtia nassauensis]